MHQNGSVKNKVEYSHTSPTLYAWLTSSTASGRRLWELSIEYNCFFARMSTACPSVDCTDQVQNTKSCHFVTMWLYGPFPSEWLANNWFGLISMIVASWRVGHIASEDCHSGFYCCGIICDGPSLVMGHLMGFVRSWSDSRLDISWICLLLYFKDKYKLIIEPFSPSNSSRNQSI